MPAQLHQLNPIVSVGALTRIAISSVAIGIAVLFVAKLALPQIVLPPAWQLLLVLPVGILYAVCSVAIPMLNARH